MQLCIWRNCQCSPTIYGGIACTKINHVNYFVKLSTLRWATISNNLMCTLHNFYSNKARFIHTSTVTRLHSCLGKKIRVRLACILSLYRNQYFWKILRQNIQQKVLGYHSVLLGASPQPCSNRAYTRRVSRNSQEGGAQNLKAFFFFFFAFHFFRGGASSETSWEKDIFD